LNNAAAITEPLFGEGHGFSGRPDGLMRIARAHITLLYLIVSSNDPRARL